MKLLETQFKQGHKVGEKRQRERTEIDEIQ